MSNRLPILLKDQSSGVLNAQTREEFFAREIFFEITF
jgi:hypothetical protein